MSHVFGLTSMQKGMLFECLRSPGQGLYVVQRVIRVAEALDSQALDQAFRDLVPRHQALRLAFDITATAGRATQRVLAHCEAEVRCEDWSGRPLNAAELEEYLRQDRARGFDLARPPLLRLCILRHAEVLFTVILTYHHLILDGRSLALLVGELLQCYDSRRRGVPLQLPPAPPFSRFLHWWQQVRFEQAQTFWREYLRGLELPTALPGEARAGVPKAGDAHTRIEFQLSPAHTAQLQRVAEERGLTLNTVLLGAWAIVLSQFSGERDVVFGTTRGGRWDTVADAERMLGLFINTLPVRLRVERQRDFTAWLQEHRAHALARRPYEQTPLLMIRQWSGMGGTRPLFESLLIFERDDPDAGIRALGPRWHNWYMTVRQDIHFPLLLLAYGGETLSLVLACDEARIEAGMARHMACFLQAALEEIATEPCRNLGALARAARARCTPAPLRTPAAGAPITALTFPQMFADQVRRAPDRVAVVCGKEALSYAELDARASSLAGRLIQLGACREIAVGLYVDRSMHMITGLLGILKAGAAYVPIDPAYPTERVRFMLTDSGAALVVTTSALADGVRNMAARCVCIDKAFDPTALQGLTASSGQISGADMAYIIYTSGTTGEPKGVAVEHHSVANLLAQALHGVYRPGELDLVAATVSIAFDGSVSQIFTPLAAGGTVLVAENLFALANDPRYDDITCLGTVPSLLESLLTGQRLPRALRVLTLAASPARGKLFQLLSEHWQPGRRLLNLYGPTEAAVYCTAADLTDLIGETDAARLAAGVRVIGGPLPNIEIQVLDGELEPVPCGVTGELCIGGAALARGYVNQPAMTAARFVSVPDATGGWLRLYRSGDLARYNDHGELELLGRRDNQVKLRGHRIELGEIEAALDRHASVAQSAVSLYNENRSDAMLAAYLVPAAHATPPSARELRTFLAASLPHYMLPSAFVVMDAFPLTAAGKVDRQALPPPAPHVLVDDAAHEATTDVEREMLAVWATVLGRGQVALDDDFFALGGNSIDALRLVNTLQERFAFTLQVSDLFEAFTPRRCAARLMELLLTEAENARPG